MLTQFDTFGPNFNIEAVRNGYFTIQNTNTGEHRTFRIWQSSERDKYPKNAQIVSLFTGTQNTDKKHYKDFAFINARGCYSFLRLREHHGQWQAMCDLLHSLITQGRMSRYHAELGYVIENSTRCFVCGRTLTTPESIESGVGPVCAER